MKVLTLDEMIKVLQEESKARLEAAEKKQEEKKKTKVEKDIHLSLKEIRKIITLLPLADIAGVMFLMHQGKTFEQALTVALEANDKRSTELNRMDS